MAATARLCSWRVARLCWCSLHEMQCLEAASNFRVYDLPLLLSPGHCEQSRRCRHGRLPWLFHDDNIMRHWQSNSPSSLRSGNCHESLTTRGVCKSSPSWCAFQQVVARPAMQGARFITSSMTRRSSWPLRSISIYPLPAALRMVGPNPSCSSLIQRKPSIADTDCSPSRLMLNCADAILPSRSNSHSRMSPRSRRPTCDWLWSLASVDGAVPAVVVELLKPVDSPLRSPRAGPWGMQTSSRNPLPSLLQASSTSRSLLGREDYPLLCISQTRPVLPDRGLCQGEDPGAAERRVLSL